MAVAPRSSWTEGEDCSFLAAAYGLPPDEWQATVINGWLGRTPAGGWAAATCGCAVPRQNGKNGILEMVELHFMVALGLRILHTAHEVKTARKAFLRLCSFFENERQYPELAALVKEIRRTNGQEAIVLTNGGSVEFIARSKGSGRGFTVDVLVCDEAQELSEDALEALTPTTSAAPSGHPMTIFTGTPPSPSMNGEVWTRVRRGAIDGTDKRIAWYEWSVDGSPDLDDRELWAATNPALGRRLNLETLEAERARFSDAGFARERLGMWASEATLAVIPGDVWKKRKAEAPPAEDAAPSALGVDRWHDGTTSVAAAWRAEDGSCHVELVAVDVTQDVAGVLAWVEQRAGRKIPVVIAGDSPAAALVPDLRARRVKVNVTSLNDLGKACVGFYDDALEGRLTHADQKQLNAALAGAKKRAIGQAGAWGWDRKNPDNDISPLVAATLARFGATVRKQIQTNRAVFA